MALDESLVNALDYCTYALSHPDEPFAKALCIVKVALSAGLATEALENPEWWQCMDECLHNQWKNTWCWRLIGKSFRGQAFCHFLDIYWCDLFKC